MKQATVLTIDDDQLNLDMIDSFLQKEDFNTESFANPLVALEKIRDIAPDVILLDRVMPEMDGHDVMRALQQSKATKDIPIIMITSKSGIKDINESLKLGAVDYIVKPFDADNVVLRLKRVLGRI